MGKNAYRPTGSFALCLENRALYTVGERNCIMSNLAPFLVLNETCEPAMRRVSGRLAAAGLQVVQTFDLQTARMAHVDCPCPHHGTEQCNCQMVVLLVYGEQPQPASLVVHSHEGRTWFSLAGRASQPSNPRLEAAIRRALGRRDLQPASRADGQD